MAGVAVAQQDCIGALGIERTEGFISKGEFREFGSARARILVSGEIF